MTSPTTTTYFHGGKASLQIGDMLVPSPPHVDDGCPICVARREGRTVTVGAYRTWLQQFGDRAAPVLRHLADAPDDAPIDPPSQRDAVYITTDREYARFYAARSRGDLYRVEPTGMPEASDEDHFASFTVPSARVVEVIERKVRLTRQDRRSLYRAWGKADRVAKQNGVIS